MDEETAYPDFLTVAKRREPVIFVTYPENPILGQKNVSLNDILESQFIISDRDIGYCALLEKELRKRKIEVAPVMEIGSVGAIINILIKSYGTSYIPKFMAEKYLKSGELVEIEMKGIHIDLCSYYICNRHRWINLIMREFIRMVEEDQIDAFEPVL